MLQVNISRAMYNKDWYEANRDRINEKRRIQYAEDSNGINEKRRREYIAQREQILQRQREDRKECPLCHLTFRRSYLGRHVATRHKCMRVATQ